MAEEEGNFSEAIGFEDVEGSEVGDGCLYGDDQLYSDEDVNSVDEGTFNEEVGNGEEMHVDEDNVVGENSEELQYAVNSLEDIGLIELWNLEDNEVSKFHFNDLSVAFEFYNRLARCRGFGARKYRTRTNSKGIRVIQTFVCSCEGYRPMKFYQLPNRKQEPRAERRCGCKARIKVRLDIPSGRWVIIYFSDEHNHACLAPRFHGMLATHRKMSDGDIMQLNSMRTGGIRTSQIYGSLATQSGGHKFVGYGLRDMYNQLAKGRRQLAGDANAAVQYLKQQSVKDKHFFFQHTVNADGSMRNLFWCDGICRRDYMVFGDVLAFDATYKKNRYRCPLVIFSGVNHHNKTIVFAAALISDEREETYTWLLEQLLVAMNGKPPVSVITDGDLAMRNAIRKVLPIAHHRLCAWHLIRNAASNVGNPKFISKFKMCMLGDFEIPVFHRKWFEMVEEFGVHDNRWVQEMYNKREMWATAHIRGKFFAGFRTTSRCEGLHSVLSKYVRSQYSFTDFLIHFKRCVDNIRYLEAKADFDNVDGFPVMVSELEPLERSAAEVYTRDIFFLFRPFLSRVSTLRFIEERQTGSCMIYVLEKYGKRNCVWHVCYSEEPMEFKCSCLRLESLGIPCEHIIALLVRLDIQQLPNCLILRRWSSEAKPQPEGDVNGEIFDTVKAARYSSLVDFYRELSLLACGKDYRYFLKRKECAREIAEWRAEDAAELKGTQEVHASENSLPKNPRKCNTKGRNAGPTGKSVQRCGLCRLEGHNRKTCTIRLDILDNGVDASDNNLSSENLIIDDLELDAAFQENGDAFLEDEGEEGCMSFSADGGM